MLFITFVVLKVVAEERAIAERFANERDTAERDARDKETRVLSLTRELDDAAEKVTLNICGIS